MKKLCKKNMCVFDELRKKYNNFVDFYKEEEIENVVNEVNSILRIENDSPIYPIAKALGNSGFYLDITELDDDLSGIIVCDESFEPIIGKKRLVQINAKDNRGHQRFTMAHELAHYIFDYNGKGIYANEYRLDDGRLDTKEERRANFFVASLLMPKDRFLDKYCAQKIAGITLDEIISNLALTFEVSETAIAKRLKELNVI